MQPLPAASLKQYIGELFGACGVDKLQCRSIAENMVWSELVGRTNFGLIRIPVHIKRLEQGVLNSTCNPKFKQLAASSCQLDADNGFGHFAGEIGMAKAVELAKQTGIGIVGVKNSNFFGTGAYFVNLAADQGMLALAMSNSFPKVVPHGGLSAVLGTNPFAFGTPRKNGENLMVDFATSSLAGSTVRQYLHKGEMLPEGLAIDANGQSVTDPAKIGEASLLPFGGAKGYGISLMVEILSGILTGAGFSNSVKSTYSNFTEKSDSGHCLIAIDIAKWMPLQSFYERFESLIALLKGSNPAGEVLLPGEIRWQNHQKNSRIGLTIDDPLKTELSKISQKYGVLVPWQTATADGVSISSN